MKKFLTVLMVWVLLVPFVCTAAHSEENVTGQWKLTCIVNDANFWADSWEQYLNFKEEGKLFLVQDGQETEGTWTADGSVLLTSLPGVYGRMQLLENGLLLCGSYREGMLFTREGKMPSYEPVEGGVSEDGFYYEQLKDGTLQITGHVSAEEMPEFDENDVMTNPVDLTLPSHIRGIPVRAVGMMAFYGNFRLRSVVLPEGILHLGREAFNDCVSLESVQLPESLSSIGGYAFNHCRQLQPVRIPAQVSDIAFNPFTGCTAMKAFDLAEGNRWYRLEDDALVEIATHHLIAFPAGTERTVFTVPDHVSTLRLAAFMGCENLQQVILPDGLDTLESFVFEDTGLQKIKLPAALTVMEDNPFNNCRNLEQVDVAAGNTVFGSVDGVLFDADHSRLIYYPIGRAAETYTVPEGTRVIGTDAFSRNRRLTEVILPASLRTIEDYAFYKMRSLTSMNIPEGVEEVGAYAFCECDELRRITFPDTVSEIENCTFSYCEDLEVVVPKGIVIDEFAFEKAQRITITYR